MDDIRNFSEDELEQLTYRVLQQIAKSMSLPSNVKKMYLIQLIYAKMHKSDVEVLEIVQRVRYERQLSSQTNTRKKGRKKMRLQAMEVSSSNACMSPPIDLTPKRPSLQYSPEMPHLGPVIKYQPRDPRSESPKNTSDRVLRSYNIRSYKRPNYSLINNSVFELVKAAERARSPKEKETQISIVSHEGRHPRLNVTARCVLKKIRPLMSNQYHRSDNVTSTCVSTSSFTHAQSTSKALVPAKRTRTLSGITPLGPQPSLKYNYEFVKSVGFRRTDGKISKINALVQTPAPKIICNIDLDAEESTSYNKVEVTIQDIINSNIDCQTFTRPRSEYTLTDSNMGYNCHVPLTDVMPQRMVEAEMNSVSVYYHKKIRAEQVRTKKEMPALLPVSEKTIPSLLPISRPHNTTSELQVPNSDACERTQINEKFRQNQDRSVACNTASEQQLLPKLSDVYGRIDDQRDEIRYKENQENDMYREHQEQPVGCSTANEPQLLPKISDVFNRMVDAREDIRPDDTTVSSSLPAPTARSNTMLEGLYNYKSDTLTQPLGQVKTTTGTRYVYSYPVTITSAIEHDPALQADPAKSYSDPSSTMKYAGTSDEVARICEFASFGEQDMTLRKYHEALRESNSSASSQLTADEMVEDALELISQDGDYMERIGMDDVRMQCILCSWAGSKFNLEYHIRKEHATEITQQDKNEWNITYKLGSLVNQTQWLSHASERDGTIYIVSVKYEDPDCLMASFSTITSMSEPEPKMGTLTLYNKVTGEPFSWHGQIMELNHKMPFENHPNCLRIELSKLELLPNSANIKLHNRTLVLNSPSKVVVGQPELNDIHIIIFVKLHDLDF